ncbi:MAG: leucine-rich repeat domain-containing protein [Holosporales bacterium]|nr:leucine-rich repeat domain-containing protein [Holosporales bacterium]
MFFHSSKILFGRFIGLLYETQDYFRPSPLQSKGSDPVCFKWDIFSSLGCVCRRLVLGSVLSSIFAPFASSGVETEVAPIHMASAYPVAALPQMHPNFDAHLAKNRVNLNELIDRKKTLIVYDGCNLPISGFENIEELYFIGDNIPDSVNINLFKNLQLFGSFDSNIGLNADQRTQLSNLVKNEARLKKIIIMNWGNCEISEECFCWNQRDRFFCCLEEVEIHKATGIGDNAFNGGNNLTKALIPDAICIGNFTFNGCLILASVSFPHVIEICPGAFSNCSTLIETYFPNATKIFSGGFFRHRIFPGAFSFCCALNSIELTNVQLIGRYAFSGCCSLRTVSIPNATQIDAFAFSDCIALGEAMLPLVTIIGSHAFTQCRALTMVNCCDARDIGCGAFSHCALVSVFCPNVETIGTGAFSNCNDLVNVSFPSATDVGDLAFSGCRILAKASLPNVKVVGKNIFKGCVALREVECQVVIEREKSDSSNLGCLLL